MIKKGTLPGGRHPSGGGRKKGFIASMPSKLSRIFRRKENVAKRIGNTKRNVTLDSNVLIAYVTSKKDNSIIRKVVTKSMTDDRLMITDVIYEECLKYATKKDSKMTGEEISKKLLSVQSGIIDISPVPPDADLLKKYKIRDIKDLKILYSVDMTDSVILVTMDDDFSDVKGVKAKIMDPKQYLAEDRSKKEKPTWRR